MNATEQLLDCVMDLGQQMLVCGGEVYVPFSGRTAPPRQMFLLLPAVWWSPSTQRTEIPIRKLAGFLKQLPILRNFTR